MNCPFDEFCMDAFFVSSFLCWNNAAIGLQFTHRQTSDIPVRRRCPAVLQAGERDNGEIVSEVNAFRCIIGSGSREWGVTLFTMQRIDLKIPLYSFIHSFGRNPGESCFLSTPQVNILFFFPFISYKSMCSCSMCFAEPQWHNRWEVACFWHTIPKAPLCHWGLAKYFSWQVSSAQ
jgi:hypothetical protein